MAREGLSDENDTTAESERSFEQGRAKDLGCSKKEGQASAPGCSRSGSADRTRKPCCRRRGGGGGALVEPAALAALLYAGGYGYDMRKTILEKTGGQVDVDVGGLYRSLRRLEEDGAVVSRWCDDATGPRRREYELTQQGFELAEQWLSALRHRQHLDELLTNLLEGGLASLRASGGSGDFEGLDSSNGPDDSDGLSGADDQRGADGS